ncbi:MAG: TonB-dependent receptor [Sphingomonas taxi]
MVALAAPSQAQATSRAYHIPAAGLKAALDAFARQSGRQILYRSDDIRSARSRGVTGVMSEEAALAAILTQTGFGSKADVSGAIAIVRLGATAGNDSGGAGDGRPAQAVAAAGAAADPVDPQDTADIVVTGIVGSVTRSIGTKRANSAIVDAVSAEDVGKFPDTNLAESLQRITGVQINRNSNGEGATVSVRGLPSDFTLATLNGATITSPGIATRTFDYNLISPDFVSQLVVYKSARADLDAGGIAANVDLQTLTPFGIGKRRGQITAKVQGDPGSTGNRYGPDVTALYSDLFADGRIGITLGVDWNKRFFRNEGSDVQPFWPTTLNGKGPYYAFMETGYYNTASRVSTTTGYASLQWQATDTLTATLNTLYSRRKLDSESIDFGIVPFAPWAPDAYNGPVTFTADQNNVLTQVSSPAAWFVFVEPITRTRDESKNFDFSVRNKTDHWDVSAALQYSRSDSHTLWQRPQLGISGVTNLPPGIRTSGGYQIYPGQPVIGYILDPALDYSNPAVWGNDKIIVTQDDARDELKVSRLDVSRRFDGGFIESIKAGGKLSSRTRPYAHWWRRYNNAPFDNAAAARTPFQPAVRPNDLATDILGSYAGPGTRPSQLFFIDPGVWLDRYFGGRYDALYDQGALSTNTFTTNSITETERDAYVMATVRSDGAIPISGNIGLRYVDTSVKVPYQGINIDDLRYDCRAGAANCNWIIPPVSQEVGRGKSHAWLPSLNLSADLRRDMMLRFAASRTMAFPPLANLVPAIDTSGLATRRLSVGNLSLSPYTSRNLDLSWEWYIGRSSLVSVALYDKRITGFLQPGSYQRTIAGQNVIVQTTVNGRQGYARGVEVDYKQTLGWLPSFWSGFGFDVNVTYSTGRQDAVPDYNIPASPFLGLNKMTYNASLFYEKGGFSALVALNHRDRYLVDSNVWGVATTQLYTEARTQIDAQASYTLDRHLTAFVNVQNLTNAPIVQTEELIDKPGTTYPGTWTMNGRRVAAGLTIKY